ncbi:hypothetical protein GCM10027396_27790 [Insolitispirillum peregrinum]
MEMNEDVMSSLERRIEASLDTNDFNIKEFKDSLLYDKFVEINPLFNEFFRKVIDTCAIPCDRYNDIANDIFDNDDDLYGFLTALYLYVYEGGSDDAVYEALERAGLFGHPNDAPEEANQPEQPQG